MSTENPPQELTADDYLARRFANKIVNLVSNGYEIHFNKEGTDVRVELSKIEFSDLIVTESVEASTIKGDRLLRIVEDLEADLLSKINATKKKTSKWKSIKRSRRSSTQ